MKSKPNIILAEKEKTSLTGVFVFLFYSALNITAIKNFELSKEENTTSCQEHLQNIKITVLISDPVSPKIPQLYVPRLVFCRPPHKQVFFVYFKTCPGLAVKIRPPANWVARKCVPVQVSLSRLYQAFVSCFPGSPIGRFI